MPVPSDRVLLHFYYQALKPPNLKSLTPKPEISNHGDAGGFAALVRLDPGTCGAILMPNEVRVKGSTRVLMWALRCLG